ncbi:MAG: DJ-1/PfpI family protein [Nanoarchaeota archaeon]
MNKRILMVIARENFRDEELLVPKRLFLENKYEVEVASDGVERAKGMLGAKTDVDIDISEVDVSDYNAVVFVGGSGVDESKVYENRDYLNVAKAASYKGKIVAAICLASKVLANAGLLSGRKASCYESAINYIKSKGANYVGEKVVQDGRIITAPNPGFAKEFGEKIIKALA